MGSKCPAGSTPGCRPRAWLTPASSDREVRSACAQAPGGQSAQPPVRVDGPCMPLAAPRPGQHLHSIPRSGHHGQVWPGEFPSAEPRRLPVPQRGAGSRKDALPRELDAAVAQGVPMSRAWHAASALAPGRTESDCASLPPSGCDRCRRLCLPRAPPAAAGSSLSRAPLAAEPRLRLHRGGGTETRDHGGGKPGTPPCAPAPG